jgi:hypothetical protein
VQYPLDGGRSGKIGGRLIPDATNALGGAMNLKKIHSQ